MSINNERPAGEDGAPEADTPKNSSAEAVLARREAARRLPPLACGCADPWRCRCGAGDPDDRTVDGYVDALAHLDSHGLMGAPLLPELRVLWRRGPDGRRIVRDLTSRWAVVA